jgi:hypothetical protein
LKSMRAQFIQSEVDGGQRATGSITTRGETSAFTGWAV